MRYGAVIVVLCVEPSDFAAQHILAALFDCFHRLRVKENFERGEISAGELAKTRGNLIQRYWELNSSRFGECLGCHGILILLSERITVNEAVSFSGLHQSLW